MSTTTQPNPLATQGVTPQDTPSNSSPSSSLNQPEILFVDSRPTGEASSRQGNTVVEPSLVPVHAKDFLPSHDSNGKCMAAEDSGATSFALFLKNLLLDPESGEGSYSTDLGEDATGNGSYVWDNFMAFDDGSKVFDDVSLGNPSHDMDALSQTDTNGETVGVEYSFGRKKAALAACVGAKAFETSIWHWTPRHGEFASEEEPHLSVPREILGKYDDILSELPPLSGKLLCDSDRDRVVALVLAFCDRSNLTYVTPSLPSLCVLERLSHRFLQFQTAEPLPWFHVPTFCAASAPEELLLGIIAYGASLMPVKALQKLGKALPNILFDALKAKVSARLALPTTTLTVHEVE